VTPPRRGPFVAWALRSRRNQAIIFVTFLLLSVGNAAISLHDDTFSLAVSLFGIVFFFTSLLVGLARRR
jgi:hypothetical protein